MNYEKEILERYLHEHIPISKSMGVSVSTLEPGLLVLSAPIAPNINHRESVFGGSAASVAILAAWSLIHIRLLNSHIHSRLVIQKNNMRYLKPIVSDFEAVCRIDDEENWTHFIKILKRKGISRIRLTSFLKCEEETVASLEGDFVAIAQAGK